MDPRQPWLLGYRAALEHQIGDSHQGEAYLDRLVEAMRHAPPGPGPEYACPASLIPVVASITGDVSRLDVAEEAAAAVLSSSSVTPLVALWVRQGLALTAVLGHDGPAAAEHYAALEPHRRRMHSVVAVDRLLGLLDMALGRFDEAVARFEDALVFCRKAGYQPELAWTCHDYADTLLQRNEPGDREKAMSLLDESLAISSELGMRPLRERVLSRREILKA